MLTVQRSRSGHYNLCLQNFRNRLRHTENSVNSVCVWGGGWGGERERERGKGANIVNSVEAAY